MLRVTLHLRVADADRLVGVWRGVAAAIARQPGVRRQELLRDPADPRAFVVSADWESAEAFHRFQDGPDREAVTAPLHALRESGRLEVHELMGEEPLMATRVMVFARVAEGDAEQFEKAFAAVRARVTGTPGHIRDELLRDAEDPTRYILLSEWESEEQFRAWEDLPIHHEMTAPMHPYWRPVERRIHSSATRR
jgi:heme-degrading monooxygenase HmoA